MKGAQNETAMSNEDLQKIWQEEVSGKTQTASDVSTVSTSDAQALAAQIEDADVADKTSVDAAKTANTDTTEAGQGVTQPSAEAQAEAAAKAEADAKKAAADSASFDSLPDTVKQALRAIPELQQANVKMEQNLRAAIGRVASIQRELDVARNQAPKAAEVGGSENLPTKADVKDASKSHEKWEQLKKDFPDWAEAIEERVSDLKPAQQQNPIDPRALAEYVQMQTQQRVEPLLETLEKMQVELVHKGWQEKIATPEFGQWLDSQKPEINALADSPRAEDAIALLNEYEAFQRSTPKPQEILQERQKRLNQSVTLKGNSNQSVKTKSEEDMTAAELWELETKRQYS